MQHTIAAVFNKQSQAQQALEDLVSMGLSRTEVRLSQNGDVTNQAQASSSIGDTDDSKESGIRSFFTELFGVHPRSDDADLYSEAVKRGNVVLTVTVPNEDLVERTTDVLERYEPVDIDDKVSEWRNDGWSAQKGIQQSGAQGINGTSDSQAIPVIQEELKVGKRTVQRGGVRVFQKVTERPVDESVSLREERVKVERIPVNQPAASVDLSALKEGTIELREMAEEAVVEKTARVVEEVRVSKEVVDRQETIHETLRGTEVEIENLGSGKTQTADMEDNYYRTHWDSHYAASGDRYEDYMPAYKYGSSLSSTDPYKGQNWNDIESNVRTDWESRNGGSASTWEKFKLAIRHGWERMTS